MCADSEYAVTDFGPFKRVQGDTQPPVEDAVRRELAALGGVDEVMARTAIELARAVDAGRSVASASRELRLCMSELRRTADSATTKDDVDELQARRAARRAGA